MLDPTCPGRVMASHLMGAEFGWLVILHDRFPYMGMGLNSNLNPNKGDSRFIFACGVRKKCELAGTFTLLKIRLLCMIIWC